MASNKGCGSTKCIFPSCRLTEGVQLSNKCNGSPDSSALRSFSFDHSPPSSSSILLFFIGHSLQRSAPDLCTLYAVHNRLLLPSSPQNLLSSDYILSVSIPYHNDAELLIFYSPPIHDPTKTIIRFQTRHVVGSPTFSFLLKRSVFTSTCLHLHCRAQISTILTLSFSTGLSLLSFNNVINNNKDSVDRSQDITLLLSLLWSSSFCSSRVPACMSSKL